MQNGVIGTKTSRISLGEKGKDNLMTRFYTNSPHKLKHSFIFLKDTDG